MPIRPPIFRPHGQRTRGETNAAYDRRRGNERQRGYTKALRRVMDAFKVAHPLCVGCRAVGRFTQTEVTDHVIPPKGNQALLWDEGNFQPACRQHHDIVKQRLEDLFAKGKANASDLKLDSKKAIELTTEYL